jgi:hypothetical protein
MLEFESLQLGRGQLRGASLYRAKVPGGWLVLFCFGDGSSITFMPDPDHLWDGSSLPPKATDLGSSLA